MDPALRRILTQAVHAFLNSVLGQARRSASTSTVSTAGRSAPTPGAGRIYEVDVRTALTHASYSPQVDGQADPGEVVWTWIPFEEDATRGKDRPVVVLGASAGTLFVAQMTSKDHDRDFAREAARGRFWIDIGSGPWDPRARPSEVRLDRVLAVPEGEVRREGATLPRPTFDSVIRGLNAVADHHQGR